MACRSTDACLRKQRRRQREAVDAFAAGDRVWVVAVVVGVVVASGAGVPRIVVVASAMR